MTTAASGRIAELEAQLVELRRELADVGLVFRRFADALPRHEPDCICQTCTVRRQALSAAALYEGYDR